MNIFKSIFLFIGIMFLLQSCVVSEKPNMAFFTDSQHDFKGVKFVSFNVPTFLVKPYVKKALRKDGENEEIIKLVKKVSRIKILTVENGSEAMLKEYSRYLNDNHYEDWATIKHGGDNINVRVKQKGDAIKNMLIMVNSDKELFFVDVKGNFTPNDISRMINTVSDK